MASQNGGYSINTSPVRPPTATSPKGQCLCSPTTHEGSFRCRFHRSSPTAWLKRSNSTLTGGSSAASLSPKSVDAKWRDHKSSNVFVKFELCVKRCIWNGMSINNSYFPVQSIISVWVIHGILGNLFSPYFIIYKINLFLSIQHFLFLIFFRCFNNDPPFWVIFLSLILFNCCLAQPIISPNPITQMIKKWPCRQNAGKFDVGFL